MALLHETSSYLVAFDAARGELVLVAASAVDLLLARDEALGADRVLAHHAAEAFLVPLSRFILHLLGTWNNCDKSFTLLS